MKIVYCLDSICGVGGTQRVTLTKATALAEIPGNEVWIVVADNTGRQVYPLDERIHLVDLEINYYKDDWKSRWYVLKGIFVLRRLHRKRLSALLGDIQPDVVVSVGQSEKYFLSSIRGKWVKIRELHFCRDYRLLSAKGLFEKIQARIGNLYDFGLKIRGYDRIMILTEEDKKRSWKNFPKVEVMPNPLSFSGGNASPASSSNIVAVGRLTGQKDFGSLIRAFSLVSGRFPSWRLDIVGEGDQRIILSNLIDSLGLDGRVCLRGDVSDVKSILNQSAFLVMTSVFEGFGLALTEAFACGLPVVSYDCPCGPKDIVTEGVDGFLVSRGDESTLAERMGRLMEDPDLRSRMGAAAKESSLRYSPERIAQMWMDLFRKLQEAKGLR